MSVARELQDQGSVGRTMSKAKPMIFSGPMVRAILEGRKTQTRRLMIKRGACAGGIHPAVSRIVHRGNGWFGFEAEEEVKKQYAQSFPVNTIRCPYGQPGDRLWVKETWQDGEFAQNVPRGPVYRATDPDWETACIGWKWKPSCFMPRWASRIMLEITGVRAERLQEISEEDAKAEGAVSHDFGKNGFGQQKSGWSMDGATSEADCLPTGRMAFASYINALHGGKNWNFWYSWPEKYPAPLWELNPWVWVVEFRPMEEAE